MLTLRSAMSIVMFLILSLSFRSCVSDTIVVRNMLKNKSTKVMVACHAPYIDWWSFHRIVSGVKRTVVNVPYKRSLGSIRPKYLWWPLNQSYYCNAFWNGVNLKVYRSYSDHEACKDNCIVELRDDGSYLWNEKKKNWDLIDKIIHRG